MSYSATNTQAVISPVQALALLAAMLLPLNVMADPAQHRHYEVYVGSAFFLDQMTGQTTWPYTAAHADGFYNHPVGWRSLVAAQKQRLLAKFAHQTAIVEGTLARPVALTMKERDMVAGEMATDGMPTEAFFENEVKPNKPQDTVTPETLAADQAEWARFCDDTYVKTKADTDFMTAAFQLDGESSHRSLTWDSPVWDYMRADISALHCGGAGLDSPVDNYLQGPPARRQAVWDMLHWTQRQGKKFIYLASPGNPAANGNGTAFIQHLRKTVASLEDNDAEPDIYAVESYIATGPDTVPECNPDGSAADTITGGAYYLLKHRDGKPGTLQLSYASDDADIADPQPPARGQVYHLVVTLTNSSSWLDYAPVLNAAVKSGAGDWAVSVSSQDTEITSQIFGSGYLFYRSQRLNPQTSQQVKVTLTRVKTDGAAQPLSIAFQLFPHTGSPAVATLTVRHA